MGAARGPGRPSRCPSLPFICGFPGVTGGHGRDLRGLGHVVSRGPCTARPGALRWRVSGGPARALPRTPVPTIRLPGRGRREARCDNVYEGLVLTPLRFRHSVARSRPGEGRLIDNALLALYGWFSLALFVIFAVAPRSSSAVAMALWSALSLALSAHIAWRRLHWVPVEGEVIEVRSGGPGSGSWSFGWRWSYGGVTHTATDVIGEKFVRYALLFNRIGRGTRATLWVDPRDPSRLLPPSWRARLTSYLVDVVMGAYGTLYLGARALGLSWGGVGGLVRLLLGG